MPFYIVAVGWKQEPDYFDKLQELFKFIEEKKQAEPAFLQRYQEAEKKLDQLSNRKLNPPPSKKEYDDAKKIIDMFTCRASAEMTTSTPTMRR